MTQENLSRPHPGQEQVTLGGKTFWADKELIPLLKELYNVGLVTRSHCSGHKHHHAWVVLRLDNITRIEVRKEGEYNEVVIFWNRI